MKTFYPIIAFALFLALLSCSKDKSEDNDEYKNICFKGRYVGAGCSDVIQIISPTGQQKIEGSSWFMTTADNKQIKFDHVIGTQVPTEYKTGDTFYFHITNIQPAPIYTTDCIPTQYVAVLENLSKTACDSVGTTE